MAKETIEARARKQSSMERACALSIVAHGQTHKSQFMESY